MATKKTKNQEGTYCYLCYYAAAEVSAPLSKLPLCSLCATVYLLPSLEAASTK